MFNWNVIKGRCICRYTAWKTILNVICLYSEISSFNSSGNSCDPPHKENWFAPPKPSLCRPIAVCRRELGACRPRWQPPISLCQSGPSYLAPAMAVIRRGCHSTGPQHPTYTWIELFIHTVQTTLRDHQATAANRYLIATLLLHHWATNLHACEALHLKKMNW